MSGMPEVEEQVAGPSFTATKVKARIDKSDAWVARAVFALNRSFDDVIQSGVSNKELIDADREFFAAIVKHFVTNGYITDRLCALARGKMRADYIKYLTRLANFSQNIE